MNIKKLYLTTISAIIVSLAIVGFINLSMNLSHNIERDTTISNINDLHNVNIEFREKAAELGYLSNSNNNWSYSQIEYDESEETFKYELYNDDEIFKASGKISTTEDLKYFEITQLDEVL